ncbi:MAG: hypothetical protein AAGA66_13880, partial [Bacteroidota bacterium]
MTRKVYHTSFKDSVRLGVCPPHIQSAIPRSNLHRWKNEPPSKYFGRNVEELDRYIQLLQAIQKHPGYFFACGRLINTLVDICESMNDFKKQVSMQKEKVIKAVSSAQKVMPLSRALKHFHISRNTFYNWKTLCEHSPIKRCKKRNLQQ